MIEGSISPSPWPSRGARDRAREMKREAVLTAAVGLFNRKGFHATSLDDVAALLNVTKPTIYHYYRSKDEVLFACVNLGLETLSTAVARVADRPGAGLGRLKALLVAYAEVMMTELGMCVVRTGDHELSPDSRARFRALKRTIDAKLRQVIEDGVRDGSLRVADVRHAAFALAGAINWIPHWYDPAGSERPDALARAIVDQLVQGLEPRPSGNVPARPLSIPGP